MSKCFVNNCKNRTSHVFNKKVVFYTFPQDPDLRSKWLKACQKNKEYKDKNERICEVHFQLNCFEERMIKPRSEGIEPHVQRGLKKESIPTEFLNLLNDRHKRLYPFEKSYDSNGVEPSQKLVRSGIPTYAELVGCTKNSIEKDAIQEPTPYTISNIITDLCAVNASTTEEHAPMEIIDSGQETLREANQERKPENIKLFLALVKELREENTQLASNNIQLQANLKKNATRLKTWNKISISLEKRSRLTYFILYLHLHQGK
ncbi:uncharacterized protein LOC143905466 [Temnothorax americanus]|uniref:uncharacterized protein LOC143905466 n=1 Tax=Temnothorax americanus TaxID=1964332 RepID=UPI0040695C53